MAEIGTVYVQVKADFTPLIEQIKQLRVLSDDLVEFFDSVIKRLESANDVD